MVSPILISGICSISMSLISSITILIYYKYFRRTSWECIEKKHVPGQYIIGRINLGNSECLYDDSFPGCYVIDVTTELPSKQASKSKTRCDNIIKNKPNVTDGGKQWVMKPYTCGKESTHYKLWNVTGYNDPNGDCSLIKTKTKFKIR